jgi:hypothetical protein
MLFTSDFADVCGAELSAFIPTRAKAILTKNNIKKVRI